jgi:hypothetical protein
MQSVFNFGNLNQNKYTSTDFHKNSKLNLMGILTVGRTDGRTKTMRLQVALKKCKSNYVAIRYFITLQTFQTAKLHIP